MRTIECSTVAVCAMLLASCQLIAGGGGGLNNTNDFAQGFVFVRASDRNVYVADSSDYQTAFRLTQGGGAKHPSLSQDGKRVVFVRQVEQETQIATVPATGGNVGTVLASTADVKNFRTPVFSPRADTIAFSFESNGISKIGLVNADGTDFRQIAGNGTLSYASPSFTPDGTALIAAAGSSVASLSLIERIDLATLAASSVTNNLGSEARQIVSRLAVSPNATKVAFDGKRTSGGARIFVIDLQTKQVTQLTDYPSDDAAIDSFPTWVSSSRVAFSSNTGGNDNVYVMDATLVKSSGGLTVPAATESWFGPVAP